MEMVYRGLANSPESYSSRDGHGLRRLAPQCQTIVACLDDVVEKFQPKGQLGSAFDLGAGKTTMEGFQNKGDRLWDIPIHNPNILKSKNMILVQHAGLYSISQPPTQQLQQCSSPIRTPPKKYNNIFHTFDQLIDLNECDILIAKQNKMHLHEEKCHKLALVIQEEFHKLGLINTQK